MNNNFNLKTEQFKSSIITSINNSNLPIGTIYYVIKDLYKDLEIEYLKILQEEQKQQEQEGQEQEIKQDKK